jgi:hypothetical protein
MDFLLGFERLISPVLISGLKVIPNNLGACDNLGFVDNLGFYFAATQIIRAVLLL